MTHLFARAWTLAGSVLLGACVAPPPSQVAASATPSSPATIGSGASSGTFQVRGRFLYDRCGEKVLLRGVNEMVVWSGGRDGVPEFAEIAKTGANVVRIVWASEGAAAELDTAITNAVQAQLIPMVEHHGATGKLEDVPTIAVAYWLRPEVMEVLKKHQAYLLLNIANEPGDNKVQQAEFEATYKSAIDALRGAGFVAPLIIDAPTWGQDIDMLQAGGPALIAHDPRHNVLLSVHTWWHDPEGARVAAELEASQNQELPLIVGEFAQHAVYQCNQSPFAYKRLLEEAHAREIGWLVWSWGGVPNNDCKDQGTFDLTKSGSFGDWTDKWAEEVVLEHPHSLKKTSIRPRSMLTGSCE
jgi:mannan endo-1,4-beta-mannosidase